MATPLETVWPALLDVPSFAACVPGAGAISQTGTNNFDGIVRVKLGPIAATFELSATLAADEAAWQCVLDVRGRERLTGTLTEARFDARLLRSDAGTRVVYVLDLTLRGRLGQLGQAVFHDVVRRIARETMDCLERRLSATAHH